MGRSFCFVSRFCIAGHTQSMARDLEAMKADTKDVCHMLCSDQRLCNAGSRQVIECGLVCNEEGMQNIGARPVAVQNSRLLAERHREDREISSMPCLH